LQRTSFHLLGFDWIVKTLASPLGYEMISLYFLCSLGYIISEAEKVVYKLKSGQFTVTCTDEHPGHILRK